MSFNVCNALHARRLPPASLMSRRSFINQVSEAQRASVLIELAQPKLRLQPTNTDLAMLVC